MVLELPVLVLHRLLLALGADVYLTKVGGAFLPELGDLWVPLVVLVGLSLILCVCFLLPTGRVVSGSGHEVGYCRRVVTSTVAEGILGRLQERRGCWHAGVAA